MKINSILFPIFIEKQGDVESLAHAKKAAHSSYEQEHSQQGGVKHED